MKVLIGCEESQAVCIAFRERGFEAYSCDLIECSGGHPEWHLKMDVFEAIERIEPDILIAHPPCTFLANSGLHYLKTKPERKGQLQRAFDFVKKLWSAPVKYIAIENPIGWLNTNWQKPAQIIQPWYFGDAELKTTCLWLKGLPLLKYKFNSDLFDKRTATEKPQPNGYCIRKTGRNAGKKYNYYFRQGKSAKRRSKTFPGIAAAMAQQWGDFLNQQAIESLNSTAK